MKSDREKFMKRNFTKPSGLDNNLAMIDEIFPADIDTSFASHSSFENGSL
jgi:hypothetical protein